MCGTWRSRMGRIPTKESKPVIGKSSIARSRLVRILGPMHFERLRVSNLRSVGDRELDFTMSPDRLRRWTLLSADPGSSFLLYALAVTGLGQRQVQMLDPQSLPRLPKRLHCPAHLEVVQVRHAPQERGSTSPSRRQLGWALSSSGPPRRGRAGDKAEGLVLRIHRSRSSIQGGVS